MTKMTCTKCGRELDPSKSVALELDQRVNEYHDFAGVPPEFSQGWFDFGIDCAKQAREKARKAINSRERPRTKWGPVRQP